MISSSEAAVSSSDETCCCAPDGELVVGLGELLGGRAHLTRRLQDLLDQAVQLVEKGVQGPGEPPHLVLGVDPKAHGQVGGSARQPSSRSAAARNGRTVRRAT